MGWAERANRAKPKTVGSWKIKDPTKLIKLGLVIDAYKLPHLQELWDESEKKAVEKMPTLDLNTRFYQENMQPDPGKLIYSFRWYTPADNREPMESVQ